MNWPICARSRSRKFALENGEAGARELCGALEIHHAERLAGISKCSRVQLKCVLGSPTLRTSALSCSSAPTGTPCSGTLGMTASACLKLLVEPALLGLGGRQPLLDRGDLALQLLGFRGVARAHGIADLLRGRVSALLALLQPAEMGAAQLSASTTPSTVFFASSDDHCRFISASTRSSGFSRIHLMSSMAETVL